MKQKIIIGAVIVLAIAVLGGLFGSGLLSRSGIGNIMDASQAVSTEDPIDITLGFYESWLSALRSTTTDPYQSGLANNPILSQPLRERISNRDNRTGLESNMLDAVLCQTTIPDNLTGKVLYTFTDKAQVLVVSKEQKEAGQAIVTLRGKDGGWYIDEILCSRGEFDVTREFSFEQDGYLLKQVPPPLDPQYWHIVFEQNGEPGHTAPLFFDGASTCTKPGSEATACQPDQLIEGSKVHLQGEMTETGVQVKHVQFIE
jgi:hypothetical protein